MKLYRDYIFKHIKETKFPMWALYVIQNYKRVPIMFFAGDNFTDNDTPESKAEKAVERLQTALQDLPADAVLCIELKSSRSANQGGILGPFEFINHDKGDEPVGGVNGMAAQFPGLIGMPPAPAGYVSEETLNGRLEMLRAENERKIQNIIHEQREQDFKEKVAREREELKQLRKELNEEKKKYESNTGAAAETLVFALKKIIAELFPGVAAAATTAAPAAALEGTNEPERQPEQVKDAKYLAVERLANSLYNNANLNEGDINRILETIQNAPTNDPQQKEIQEAAA